MLALRQQKDRLESIAIVMMVVGILLMVNPFSLALYGIGFPVLLIGLIAFIIVSHF